jgi:signal transduction histidine kinase/ligand-binding sensor domain-containing protein
LLFEFEIKYYYIYPLYNYYYLKKIITYFTEHLLLKNKIGLLVVLLFTISKSNAQLFNFENLSSKDGLSQNMVYDVVEDASGYIWIATKDGLNRYDGNNVKIFTHDVYNKYSLSGNLCTSLLVDTKGRLWIGTASDGVNLYDPKTERFYKARVKDDSIKKDGNYPILYFKEDKAGNIWVLTEKNFKVFKIATPQVWPSKANFSEWVTATPERAYPKLTNIIINQKAYNCDWVNRNVVYNRILEAFKEVDPYFQQVLYDAKGTMWLACQASIIFFKNNTLHTIKFPNANRLVFINYLQDGDIAICNQKYIWKMKPEVMAQQVSLDATNAFLTLPSELLSINQIMQDKNSNIWLSTAGYGLYKIDANFKKFESSLPGLSINNIFADNNNTIFLKGFANPAPFYHQYNNSTKDIKILPTAISGFPQKNFTQDANNNYWMVKTIIYTDTMLIIQYDNKMKQVAVYTIKAIKSDFDMPVSILLDGNWLWIGNADGELIQFNMLTHESKYYYYQSLIQKKGIQFANLHIYKDAQQMLWLCTQNGLVQFNYKAKQPIFKMYKNSSTNQNSLSNNYTSCSVDDVYDKNKLWISTKSGLERLNKTTGVFEHFTTAAGLPNNVVYGILVGADSNYWVSTNKGISRVNSRTLKFTNYNKKDGLQDEEFNTNSYCKCKDDNLIFGGINGITKFDPRKLFANKNAANVQIVDFKINNKSINANDESDILKTNINYTSVLDLNYNQNQLGFELAILDFTNPSKNVYKYQLQGIDNSWIEAGTNRFANYAQVPNGDYIFNAMASADGETWSALQPIKIIIHPPWYRTWLAYFIYLLVISSILFYFYKNKIREIRLQEQLVFKEKEATQLAALNIIKTNFFSNISHEIRTPLTLILAPSEMLAKQNPGQELQQLIFRNAKRLLELINQILDISKLEAGQMPINFQLINAVTFFNNACINFKEIAAGKNISVTLTQNKSAFTLALDEDKMQKIMNNLLSNAVKFTPDNGNILVDINYNEVEKNYSLHVTDTGIGIPDEKMNSLFTRYYQANKLDKQKYEGTGIGLALTQELVLLLKGTIEVNSIVNQGTSFNIKLPLIASL